MNETSSWKEKLALKFGDAGLLRVLLFNVWFRWALLFVILATLVMFVGLLKIWTTSPPDFAPVIKVSWLDLIQARSMKKTALEYAKAGKHEEAAYAWQVAIANNAADPDLIRGSLEHLLQSEGLRPKAMGQAVGITFWLLRLSATNSVDVDLAAQVYDKYNLAEYQYVLLKSRETQLSATQKSFYLKAHFLLGKMDDFGKKWPELSAAVTNDPELALYRAAYEAGWGPPETLTEGKARLEGALENSPQRALANRLQLMLSTRLVQPDTYREALHRLQSWHQDRVLDHIGYWQLLLAVGRRAEARQLAENYPNPPALPWEVVSLARVYIGLGMEEYAQKFLARYAPEFAKSAAAWSTAIWAMYANLLIEMRRWDELKQIALQIRLIESLQLSMTAYSYYLEGRALYSMNQHMIATQVLKKAAAAEFQDPRIGLEAAVGMLRMNHAEIALQILTPLEKEMEKESSYWQTVFEAGYALKSPSALLRAATKCYEFHPENQIFQNNYAAALLISRQNPELASRLTFSLLSKNPNSIAANVNHSFALTMNGRQDEAEALLRKVNPVFMKDVEISMYYLNWFEVHLLKKQYELAAKDLSRINTNHLFSNQLEWLNQKQKELPSIEAAK
jgi:hypothetical protein